MTPPTDRLPPTSAPLGRAGIAVFLPFAFAFFLIFFFRTANAVIAPNITADLELTAADLGLLTALYFLTFAAMQIPIGMLLDRFGPRRVQTALLLVCALGSALFGLAETKAELGIGRALLGLGAAAGLMSGLKSIALWFPRERLPVVNSVYLSIGGLGAMTATVPLEAFLTIATWRDFFLVFAAIAVIAAICIYIFVPERPVEAGVDDQPVHFSHYLAILRDRLFWRVTPLFTMIAGVTMALQSLWSGPWLRDVAGLDRALVADHLMFMMLAFIVGQLSGGLIADLGRRIGFRVTSVIAVAAFLYLVATVAIIFEATGLGRLLWMGYAVFAAMGSLSFAVLAQHFPSSVIGRVNATANACVVLGAFIAQAFVGLVLDLWPLTADGGYDPRGYQVAFAVILALQILAYIWFLMGRRKGDLS